MFKVGDEVKCIEHHPLLEVGRIYTVAAVDGGYVGVRGLCDDSPQWFSSRFSLVSPASSNHSKECDPNGTDPHAPGAKLDAGKLRPALVLGGFANALLAVTKVGTDGAAKYTDNGWKEVPNGFARYSDAEARHRLKRESGETTDPDSGSLHLAHEAWNALAKLELYLKEQHAK